MPNLGSTKATAFLPFLVGAMKEFDIDTPARAAAFLAQLAHESGELRFMEEIWGPTPAQLRYEPVSPVARSLGNTQPGDGKRFKGRGPIQVTGRANYRVFGDALGVDLVGNPPLAATNNVGFRTAGLYWKKRGLNELADQQRFESITRRLNGGVNGLADRIRYYERAKVVLGVPALRGAPGTPDDGAGPVFSRGLDQPGEITPTVAERAPRTAARKRPPARKTPSRKASGRKSRAKPAASRSRTRKKPRVKKSTASTRRKRSGVPAAKRSRVRRSVARKRSAPSGKKARSRKRVASRGRKRAKR
jgi:predicted chitinase